MASENPLTRSYRKKYGKVTEADPQNAVASRSTVRGQLWKNFQIKA